jgi:hypothetical protein
VVVPLSISTITTNLTSSSECQSRFIPSFPSCKTRSTVVRIAAISGQPENGRFSVSARVSEWYYQLFVPKTEPALILCHLHILFVPATHSPATPMSGRRRCGRRRRLPSFVRQERLLSGLRSQWRREENAQNTEKTERENNGESGDDSAGEEEELEAPRSAFGVAFGKGFSVRFCDSEAVCVAPWNELRAWKRERLDRRRAERKRERNLSLSPCESSSSSSYDTDGGSGFEWAEMPRVEGTGVSVTSKSHFIAFGTRGEVASGPVPFGVLMARLDPYAVGDDSKDDLSDSSPLEQPGVFVLDRSSDEEFTEVPRPAQRCRRVPKRAHFRRILLRCGADQALTFRGHRIERRRKKLDKIGTPPSTSSSPSSDYSSESDSEDEIVVSPIGSLVKAARSGV